MGHSPTGPGFSQATGPPKHTPPPTHDSVPTLWRFERFEGEIIPIRIARRSCHNASFDQHPLARLRNLRMAMSPIPTNDHGAFSFTSPGNPQPHRPPAAVGRDGPMPDPGTGPRAGASAPREGWSIGIVSTVFASANSNPPS